MIDLRSDTVTRPTDAMTAAMFAAPVGDDVYGEDPTVNALEEAVAVRLGKEAAIFVPSGTMANQIAVRLHCRPGEELICEETSHVVLWEGGGPAALSGVTVRPLPGAFGRLSLAQLEGLHRPDDIHSPPSKLLWLENTHNRGGGTCYDIDAVRAMGRWARQEGMARHLDGARLWNAMVATGVPADVWAAQFDTVSVCFSKGLGAPVGSALAGTKEQMKLARRYRKMFGGGMRQAGMIAAACLYAMEHHVTRLADDHANAKLLADAVRSVPGFTLVPPVVETNLVWFEVDRARHGSPQDVTRKLREQGVLMSALGETTVRAVTHLDVTREQCEQAAVVVRSLAWGGRAGPT
ncbi:MAG: low-specificity L-threonine aldolase [Fimbriiglobus sp.]|jgi:threonine aldolase|nr:low-specificity L-threonine aldolase [Fimbriiglobus sp.]